MTSLRVFYVMVAGILLSSPAAAEGNQWSQLYALQHETFSKILAEPCAEDMNRFCDPHTLVSKSKSDWKSETRCASLTNKKKEKCIIGLKKRYELNRYMCIWTFKNRSMLSKQCRTTIDESQAEEK